MILPSKVLSFQDSILCKTITILNALSKREYNIYELYNTKKEEFQDINEFLTTLDVLYVLDKVTLDLESKVISYVKENNL